MFRYPFGVFEWYRGLPAAHPWQMNWLFALSTATSVLILGKGAEKIVCRQDPDIPRRSMRMIVPYWMKDYRWDQTKQ